MNLLKTKNPKRNGIKTSNIEFKLERYYCPSEAKTYEASLPEYIDGEFGAGLKSLLKLREMTQEKFEKELNLAIPGLKGHYRTMILEAAAIAAYQESHDSPTIERLVCDDAKQFYYITPLRALCWIHEERHYKKLTPLLCHHQKLTDDFRSKIWDYYCELTEYKKNPDEEEKIRLSDLFDEIFSTKIGYDQLDERIKLTKAKKDNLLVVLDYPDTPLHNNPALSPGKYNPQDLQKALVISRVSG